MKNPEKMADYLKDILKNQIIDLFEDILRLSCITNKQRCFLNLGKDLIQLTEASVIMKELSQEMITIDLETSDIFDYIFSCLVKKQFTHSELIKDAFGELYHQQLSPKDRETVMEYARQMKKICEKSKDKK